MAQPTRTSKRTSAEERDRIPQPQVETVLTTRIDALIGIPTTVSALPIIEIPLITPTELVPVVICNKHFYISVAFHDICS